MRDIARLISLIEDGSPEVPSVMRELAPTRVGRASSASPARPASASRRRPSALVTALRARGQRVGVLAVDPSSPFSGGALLGDRIRMQAHATDEGVFIRSMASRGHLGGLSATTPQALRVLDAAGFDVVLVETVGVGQSEVEVAAAADTTLVLLAPGMGDGIQAAKAGILEIGDVFVVNKADRDGADATVRELRSMIALGERPRARLEPPVVKTVASTGQGIDRLLAAIDEHRRWLEGSGELHVRRESARETRSRGSSSRRFAAGSRRGRAPSGSRRRRRRWLPVAWTALPLRRWRVSLRTGDVSRLRGAARPRAR